MSDKKVLSTTYLEGEGRDHVYACLEATFNHCVDHEVRVIVIYTATGEGPCLAVERFLSQPRYSNIRLVAVTPPANKTYVADSRAQEPTFVQTGIVGERRKILDDAKVPVVSARLPFRSVVTNPNDSMLHVDRAFGILGGGFSYCLQAVLMACDAGHITSLERVAAMSADTSLVVVASQSESFFSPHEGLLVEHIICRPLLYDISKRVHFMTAYAVEHSKQTQAQPELPLATSDVEQNTLPAPGNEPDPQPE